MPRPDFPRNLPEFLQRFPDEATCAEYVYRSRWPDGWACPSCGSVAAYSETSRGRIECRGCAHQTSVTAGTIMHRSHLPLSKWLLAAYFVTTDKRGISAKYLGQQLGVGYETAWGLLHKLRAAMIAPERSKLSGTIELDETEIGCPKRGRAREDTPEKMIVVGAVERRMTDVDARRCAERAAGTSRTPPWDIRSPVLRVGAHPVAIHAQALRGFPWIAHRLPPINRPPTFPPQRTSTTFSGTAGSAWTGTASRQRDGS